MWERAHILFITRTNTGTVGTGETVNTRGWGPSSKLAMTDGLIVPPNVLQLFPLGFNFSSVQEDVSILSEWTSRDKQEMGVCVKLGQGGAYRCLRRSRFHSVCSHLSRPPWGPAFGRLSISCASLSHPPACSKSLASL